MPVKYLNDEPPVGDWLGKSKLISDIALDPREVTMGISIEPSSITRSLTGEPKLFCAGFSLTCLLLIINLVNTELSTIICFIGSGNLEIM